MAINNQNEVLKNKMMRGQVLRTLTLFYPAPVCLGNLKTALISRGIMLTADTTKIIHYLQDKQYIKISKPNIQEIEDDDLIELTSKGIDLIEGTIEDAGVEL